MLSKIGSGGMGDVSLAEDRTLGRRVALKTLPPDRTGTDPRARFEREAKILAALKPPQHRHRALGRRGRRRVLHHDGARRGEDARGSAAEERSHAVANVWRVPILGDREAGWEDAEQVTFDEASVASLDAIRPPCHLCRRGIGFSNPKTSVICAAHSGVPTGGSRAHLPCTRSDASSPAWRSSGSLRTGDPPSRRTSIRP